MFLFGLFIEIGLAPPAKEFSRPLPIPESYAVPLIIAEVRESGSSKCMTGFFWPWDDGDDDEFLVISIGDVEGMSGVNGSSKRSIDGEEALEDVDDSGE